MSIKKADTLWESFKQRVEKREQTRVKIEALFTRHDLDEEDILTVYDGLFLGLFTDFEQFLEELFWGLLKGKISLEGRKTDEVRKVKISPSSKIETVILGGLKYLDWLPYNKTIERAEIFFKNGIPFTNLTSEQKNNLGEYHRIRNAIAHKSPKAKEDFDKIIPSSSLLPSEKTPAGYLRSKPRGNQSQTQYEIAANKLLEITLILCKNRTED